MRRWRKPSAPVENGKARLEMALPGVQSPYDVWAERLGASGDAVIASWDNYQDELEVRDGLILEAIDQGWPRPEVARWARVSTRRVTQVVSARSAELAYGAGPG
jgi:hypothetical protein